MITIVSNRFERPRTKLQTARIEGKKHKALLVGLGVQ